MDPLFFGLFFDIGIGIGIAGVETAILTNYLSSIFGLSVCNTYIYYMVVIEGKKYWYRLVSASLSDTLVSDTKYRYR